MKNNKKTIIILMVLLIMLISIVSFAGIYMQKQNRMVNILKDYQLGMQFSNQREINYELSTMNVIYDKDGNKVEEQQEGIEYTEENGYTTKQEQISKNLLNDEVYNKTQKIIKERLTDFGIYEYSIDINKENGNIKVKFKEDINLENISSNLIASGKMEIIDAENNTVLMDNSHFKSSSVLYNTTEEGTVVYLKISFNKEGKQKLEEISKNYIKTTKQVPNVKKNEETGEEYIEYVDEEELKKVTLKISGEDFLTTYFGETMTTGELTLTVGSATTEQETLSSYVKEASTISTILNNGQIQLEYTMANEEVIKNTIDNNFVRILIVIAVVLTLILLIFEVIKSKTKGIFIILSSIGFIALVLLAIRYTNVILTLEGIIAIYVVYLINYIVARQIFKCENSKEINKTLVQFYKYTAVLWIIAIILCFVKWIPVSSIGMVIFWSGILIGLYNFLITKTLAKQFIEE